VNPVTCCNDEERALAMLARPNETAKAEKKRIVAMLIREMFQTECQEIANRETWKEDKVPGRASTYTKFVHSDIRSQRSQSFLDSGTTGYLPFVRTHHKI
jgi:hypothetical protein